MTFAYVIIAQLETSTEGRILPLLYLLYLVTTTVCSDQVSTVPTLYYKEHNLHTAGNEIKRLPDPTPGQIISLNPYDIYPRRRCSSFSSSSS
jgi:hypothetical protein